MTRNLRRILEISVLSGGLAVGMSIGCGSDKGPSAGCPKTDAGAEAGCPKADAGCPKADAGCAMADAGCPAKG
jgi:hypothetical protein